jgi:hypothetical protein
MSAITSTRRRRSAHEREQALIADRFALMSAPTAEVAACVP